MDFGAERIDMIDSQTPNVSMADRILYLQVFRTCIRYRNPETGRRHFCHEKLFRVAFLSRVLELKRIVRPKGKYQYESTN